MIPYGDKKRRDNSVAPLWPTSSCTPKVTDFYGCPFIFKRRYILPVLIDF
jgi:hypothetical protein